MTVFIELAIILACIGIVAWLAVKVVGDWITRDKPPKER